MNDFWEQLREQVTRVWEQLNVQQKVMFVAAPVVLVIVFGVAMYIAGRPKFQNLFSSQDLNQVNQVKQYLEDNNIEYQAPNANTIQVESELVPKLTIELGGQGLMGTQTGPGFELFDNLNIGMTDQVFDVQRKRALENKLSKIIMEGSQNITGAHVSIEIPARSIFKEDEIAPSASVKLVSNSSIPQTTVEGVQRLVAYAVAGLDYQRVVVLDKNNKALSEDTDVEPGAQQAYKRMQVRLREESILRNKLEEQLTSLAGLDNYTVSVNVTMDWEKKNIHDVMIDPETAAVISQKDYVEKSVTRGISGAPGVVSNTQDDGIGTEGETSDSSIEENIKNFRHSYTDTHTEEEQGEVVAISVGILVNHYYNAEDELVPRDPTQLDEWRQHLRTVAGLSPTALVNDPNNFSIISQKFDNTQERKLARERLVQTVTSIVRSMIPLVLLFALGYFAYIFFQRAFAPPEIEEEEITEEIPIEPVSDAKELTLSQLGLAEFGDIASLPAEEQRRIKMQEHVINYAAEKPEEVAAIIKAWLSS